MASYSRRREDQGEPIEGVDAPPDPLDDIDPLSLPEDEQLVYDLAAWPITTHPDVVEALADARLTHAWAGTDLVLHVRHEERADALLSDIERRHGLESAEELSDGAGATAAGGLARRSGEEVEYDLADWPAELRAPLTGRLIEADVAFRWEGGFLVVASMHEAATDAVLDDVEAALGEGELGDGSISDDEPGGSAMSRLFVAVDDLVSHPNGREAILRLDELFRDADAGPVPFGLEVGVWDHLLDQVSDLLDLALEAEDAADVRAEAVEVRNALRPLV